ncbi:MAG: DUF1553 domain-containing protein [Rubripirellula sp.]
MIHSCWLGDCACSVRGADVSSQQRDFFESKIRPVLVQKCYECHSADSDELGGGLRIDNPDGMTVGGESGPIVVPGRPDESLLIQALRYDDLEMPPEAPLSDAIIKDFVKWVSLGAPDPRPLDSSPKRSKIVDEQSVWSFQPRQQTSTPEVMDQRWPRDAIDHYVLARMETAGLAPVADADARTLIRRLHYDLIGLPPTDTSVKDFVAAHSRSEHPADRRQVVQKWVDQLLSSPQFGVRWGRHWLDVARYGESNGDDGLGRNATFPHAWRYRDYVVSAFNSDTPYDQFLTEQIAGDLLPANSAEQRNRQLTATGFLAIGSKPAAAMNKNFAMDVVDDQINVVCTGVIGLSVACARCHDHKHDPVPTRDYYALAGIFASTETLYGAAGNEKLTAPPTPLHELRSTWIRNQLPIDRTTIPVFPEGYHDFIRQIKPVVQASLQQKTDDLELGSQSGSQTTYSESEFAQVKGASFRGDLPNAGNAYTVSFWFRNTVANDARPITAYLFSRAQHGEKSLAGDHLGIGGKHDKSRTGKLFVFNGNVAKQSIAVSTVIPPNSWNHIVLVRNGGRVKVLLNGRQEIDAELAPTFDKSTGFCLASRSDDFAPLTGNVGELAVFDRALGNEMAISLHRKSGQPIGIAPVLVDGYAMGVRDKSAPSDSKIHINGDGAKLGPEVPRGFLTAYAPQKSNAPETFSDSISSAGSGRMELARWLTDRDHPQTARVMVNRVWSQLMGHGIVTTPDDFGVYGDRPTHPELLDYLANQFVEQDWSVKQLIRRIVLTRTYQLGSLAGEDAIRIDPSNRWLARHSRRRLDAESLRDSVLQTTGGLDMAPQSGSAIQEIDALINWPPGEATNLHRDSSHRSLYLCQLRHASPKELAAFDLPSGVEVLGKRDVTLLPTQTLYLLNGDFVVASANSLASRMLLNPELTDDGRIKEVFRRILQRLPSSAEGRETRSFLKAMDAGLATRLPDREERRLQLWSSFCQALLMTSEFRYVD